MNRRNAGFSLVELMVVIVIIGILASIAYPSYKQFLVKTRRADAMAVLTQFGNAMERYYLTNNSYLGAGTIANSNADANSAGAPTIFPTQAPLDGGSRFYNLTIDVSTTATSYLLVATPIGDQASDGIIRLSSAGARQWDSENDGFGATDNDWEP